MTTYRLFPATNGPAAPTPFAGDFLAGVMFSPTGQMAWFDGYWWWPPPGGDLGAQKFALWNRYSTSAQQLLAGSVVTSGPLTAGQWNFVPLAMPLQLAPGGLYVAATGWVSVNGFPDTNNQFGSGDPFAAGITNGPLTAWSDLTGSNEWLDGSAGNYSLDQGLFSSVLGADPSASMPNAGSNSANFWMDVQLDTSPPAGYSGSYRVDPNRVDLGNYALDTANNFTLGRQFSLSQACTIDNIWFYSPATVTQLPTWIGVFTAPGAILAASNPAPAWSGAAGSGWVSAALTGTLPAGTYKVCVCNEAATPAIWNAAVAGYYSTGFGANGLTSGPITVPDNAAALSPGQETYNLGAAPTYPLTNAGPFKYGLDIEVTPAAAAATTAAVAGSREEPLVTRWVAVPA